MRFHFPCHFSFLKFGRLYMPKGAHQFPWYSYEELAIRDVKPGGPPLKLHWPQGPRSAAAVGSVSLRPKGTVFKCRKRPCVLTKLKSCSFEVKINLPVPVGDSLSAFPSKQQLPPHVRIWDSVTLNTLHVLGVGFFDRAVTCIAFSKSVSAAPWVLEPWFTGRREAAQG